jgi:hypothetical protein
MATPDRKRLWKSVLRQTARDDVWLGYWLRRHRRTEKLTASHLAGLLGLSGEGLVLLSLCQTPREDHFREDLQVICRRTGANEGVLARILRQEQGLARWADTSSPTEGWLMAASDTLPPEPKDREHDSTDPASADD